MCIFYLILAYYHAVVTSGNVPIIKQIQLSTFRMQKILTNNCKFTVHSFGRTWTLTSTFAMEAAFVWSFIVVSMLGFEGVVVGGGG